MTKIKVHELAKELGLPSKEVLAFLQEKGVEAKVAQSSVEEDAAAMVRKKFKAGSAPAKKSVKETEASKAPAEITGKASAEPAEKTPAETAEKAPAETGAKTAEKASAEAAGKAPAAEENTSAASAGRTEAVASSKPKKKKTIIFVNNPGNSKIQGNRMNTDRRSNNGVVRSGIISGGKLVQPGDEKPKAPVRPAAPAAPVRPAPEPAANEMNKTPAQPAAKPTESIVQPQSVETQQPAQTQQPSEAGTGTVKPVEPTVRTASQSQGQSRPAGGYQGQNYQGQNRNSDNRGQSRPYNNGTGGGQSRPYNNGTGGGQSRPYNNGTGGGQSRPYNNGTGGGQSRPYNNGTGGGQSRPYNNGTGGGQSRPYNNGTGGGQSRPYNNGTGGGQSRPYSGVAGQNRNGSGDRNGQNRPYSGGPGQNRNGQGRPGNRDGAKAYSGGGASAGGNRFGGAGGRDQRGTGRPDSRFAGKSTGKETSVKDAEQRKRDEEKRRINQERGNKRSKKDLIYEEEEAAKAKKAGRFIRPEVKPKDEREDAIKVITLPEVLTIKELAEKMKLPPAAIIKKLFLKGRVVTVNQEISYEEAEEIAIEYDIICEKEVKVDVIEELLKEEEENSEDMVVRPPVICVMGHVDHGKTSLLDAIRKTNVTDREAGGITQHIGAYTVNINDRKITFLDTPGHEAFTAMRMRGANATDIAVLVVAADDGVMPQTVEAINHAKAAGIEIIVAVNKMDKPNANIDRVKQELAEYELVPEDWGGSTVFAPVSAKTGEGIPQLLEMILLTADIQELKANPNRRARGLVIEAQLDKGRGPVATVLVQKGKLHVSDFISAGASHGKVRAMIDDKGRRVKEAGPSTPVEILGLSDVPNAGEVFLAHDDDKTARSYAATFISQSKEKKLEETRSKMSLDDLFNQIREGDLKELGLIVKADVQGSVEALKQSLLKLSNEEVVVKCIHGGVGAINESDVTLASASNAIIIGFNVRPDAVAKATAEREGVDIRLYRVIYQAIEDIEAAMKGMLAPVYEEKVLGHAEVRQIFKASAVGNISGAYVLDGTFERGCKVRITRAGEQIFEGGLASLKRFKDDVKEVKAGYECGLVFEGFDQIQELDIIEAYKMVEVPR